MLFSVNLSANHKCNLFVFCYFFAYADQRKPPFEKDKQTEQKTKKRKEKKRKSITGGAERKFALSGKLGTFLLDNGFISDHFPPSWEAKRSCSFAPILPPPTTTIPPSEHPPGKTRGQTQTLVCLQSLASISLPKYLPLWSGQRANISASTRTA